MTRLHLVAFLVTSLASAVEVKKAFIVFSNHFDMGYTDNDDGSCAGAVINRYFQDHFPKAMKTAQEARQKGKFEYRWMTQSWLVNTYRHCAETKVNIKGPDFPSDLICPNATELADFIAAVKRKDIGWHAFPFNAEPEVYTPELFDAGLNMTFGEDAFFGHAPRKTLSLRDVPGLTRAAIPLLARRNVSGVSVGENSQCAPVNVPPIFLWRDNASDTSVVAMYHPFGYGRRRLSNGQDAVNGTIAINGTICGRHADGTLASDKERMQCQDDESVLRYIDSNGNAIAKAGANPFDAPGLHVEQADGQQWEEGTDGFPPSPVVKGHCLVVEAAEAALCFSWRVDNSGPHSYVEAELVSGL
jgi:hypothetical protein